jgi:hypothetical protein
MRIFHFAGLVAAIRIALGLGALRLFGALASRRLKEANKMSLYH